MKYIPDTTLYISFDLNLIIIVSDIRNGEIYHRSLYINNDTPGIRSIAAKSNGEVYFVFSTTTISIYNVFL